MEQLYVQFTIGPFCGSLFTCAALFIRMKVFFHICRSLRLGSFQICKSLVPYICLFLHSWNTWGSTCITNFLTFYLSLPLTHTLSLLLSRSLVRARALSLSLSLSLSRSLSLSFSLSLYLLLSISLSLSLSLSLSISLSLSPFLSHTNSLNKCTYKRETNWNHSMTGLYSI